MTVDCSRREFMRRALRACAGASGLGSLLAATGCTSAPPISTNRKDRRVLADLHVHIAINRWNRRSPLFVQYPAMRWFGENYMNESRAEWEDCYAAGIDLLCVTHFSAFDEWASMPTDPSPEAPANTLRMMDLLEQELRGPAGRFAKLARNRDEMTELLQVPKTSSEWRIPVVQTIEGAHALGGDPGVIRTFADRGVAVITATHFFNKGIASAANSFPYFPDAGSRWDNQGLTCLGRKVIKKMEDYGIIVDVTHAPAAAVAGILDAATKPLLATHVSARTLGDHPYSLYDEHIQQIARDGGIIGIVIDPYLLSNYATLCHAEREGTLRQVVRTIRHVVKLCGDHKHVGIGSDFCGYITPPKDMKRLSRIGELRRLLLEEFDDDIGIVEDILAGNAIRFLQANWGSGL